MRPIPLAIAAVISFPLFLYVRLSEAPHLHPITPFTATAVVLFVVWLVTRRKGDSS